jgi:hypothetical protein
VAACGAGAAKRADAAGYGVSKKTPRVHIARRDVCFSGWPRESRLPREVLRLDQMIASSGSEWAQRTAAAFAEAVAREFDSSGFEGVPVSPDLEWLRICVDYLARGDA